MPNKERYYYIPSTLKLNELLPAREYERHGDKYKYFIHKIYEERVLNKTITEDWVPLYSVTLQNILTTRHHGKIKKWLIKQGIIECDESYSDGGRNCYYVHDPKCKWYKIGEKYRNVPAREHLYDDKPFAAKLERHRICNRLKITDDVLRFLNFNLHELKIDFNAAHTQIEANYQLGQVKYVDDEEKLQKVVRRYNYDKISATKIHTGEFFLNRDDTGMRVHTNLTNASKTVRKHLYIDTGKELVNLDIRNSQPLLLSFLLKKEYGKNLPQDVQDYISLCESGLFYEEMMDLMGIPKDDEYRKDIRSEFKVDLFGKVFYCKNVVSRQYRESKVFENRFPNAYQVIKKHKAVDYSQLSIQMQKFESLILTSAQGCVGQIAKQYSPEDFFCLTIHDSIVTTRDKADWVKKLMQQEFAKWEVYPTINIEAL